MEEGFGWFGLPVISALSGNGTRAWASALLPRSAWKIGVKCRDQVAECAGWPGLSEPHGGAGPLAPGVREAGFAARCGFLGASGAPASHPALQECY